MHYKKILLSAIAGVCTVVTLIGAELKLPLEIPYTPLNWNLGKSGKPVWKLDIVPKSWKEKSLNGEWKFKEIPFVREAPGKISGALFNKAEMDDKYWRKVQIPDSWYLKTFNNGQRSYTKGKIGWFRRSFDIAEDFNTLLLDFRRVANHCDVWVNGKKIGKQHVGRFASFQYDISKFVKKGKNTLAVRVYDYVGHKSYPRRWIGGIYQPVRLLYIPVKNYSQKMMITSNLQENSISIRAQINSSIKGNLKLSYEVINWKDKKLNCSGKLGKYKISKASQWLNFIKIKLHKPVLWNTTNPHLYVLRLLNEQGQCIGVKRFGFRDFLAKGSWLYLNGKKFKLRAHTLHLQHYPNIQNNVDMILREIILFYKNININMIRHHSSQGTYTETFYNLCDELGMPIYFDWSGADFYQSFDKKWKNSSIEMWQSFKQVIMEHYSHPSIVMWSFGNEIYEGHHNISFSKNLNTLYRWVKKLDQQGRPICSSTGRQTLWAISNGSLKEQTDVLDDHQYRGTYSGSWQDNIEHIENYAKAAYKAYGKAKPKINCEYGIAGDNIRYRAVTGKVLRPAFDMDPSSLEFKKKYISFLQSPQAEIGTYIRLLMNYCSSRIYVKDEAECRRLYAQKYFKRPVEIYRRAGEKCIGGHTNTQWYDVFGLPYKKLTRYFKGLVPEQSDKAFIKPLAFTTKRVYNPTLVSAGVFNQHPIGGTKQQVDIYVTNDLNEAGNFKVVAQLRFKNSKLLPLGEIKFGIIRGMKQKRMALNYSLPAFDNSQRGKLELYLFKNGKRVGDNYYFISCPVTKLKKLKSKVALYDNFGRLFRGVEDTVCTTKVLKDFSYAFEHITDFSKLAEYKYLIIGANSFDQNLIESSEIIYKWVKAGGKVLCFEQNCCGKIPFFPNNIIVSGSPSTYVSLSVYNHPIFAGLEQEDFDSWAKYRGTLFDYAMNLNESLVAVSPSGSWSDVEEIKSVISDVKLGKGQIIFSQVSATKRYNLDAVAKAYLKNILNYFSQAGVSKFATSMSEKALGKTVYLADKDVFYFDISKVVNQGFKDDLAEDQKGGWTDFGASTDFRDIPVGISRLQGTVPFKIINPDKNNGKSCIVLKGAKRPYFPTKVVNIPVNKLLNNIYVLHTSMYTKPGPAVKYIIHYEDGKSHEFIATGKYEIPDWWNPKNRRNAIVVFQKKRKGLYLSDFVNPRPKSKIKSMDIVSCGKTIPIIVAITGKKRFTSLISGVGEK